MDSALIPSNRDSDSLALQVRSAVIWRSGSQILAQLVQWAATFLVIRILDPGDYGLFAMTQVILVLFNMLNGYGLASGLIQRDAVSRRQVRQLFGMLLLVNASLAVAQLALAPLAAAYYRQPIIADMLRVQALLYATTPFVALSYALLSREMDFRVQARVNILASIASASTALTCALAGLGVWTLVIAPLVLFSVRAIGMTVAVKMLVWPSFDFRGAGSIARYGGIMAVGQLFWFVESQADIFIAGRAFSPHLLGIYTTGLFLTQIFVAKVVPPLNEVAFSAYARLQNDQRVFAYAFTRGVRVVMVAALPFYFGLVVTAEPLVLTMLGAKWAETIPVVRLLALAMPFMTLQVLFAPACDALGQPGTSVRNGATGALILAVAYLMGVQWGLTGLCWASVVAYPAYVLLSARRALPVIGVRARDLIDALAPAALAATAMAIAVAGIDMMLPIKHPVTRLCLLAALGVVVYAGWLLIFAQPLIADLRSLVLRRPANADR